MFNVADEGLFDGRDMVAIRNQPRVVALCDAGPPVFLVKRHRLRFAEIIGPVRGVEALDAKRFKAVYGE
jgi:hypothetical protein